MQANRKVQDNLQSSVEIEHINSCKSEPDRTGKKKTVEVCEEYVILHTLYLKEVEKTIMHSSRSVRFQKQSRTLVQLQGKQN